MVVHAAQIPLMIVSAACVVAEIVDAWKFRVPNLLTLTLLGVPAWPSTFAREASPDSVRA